MKTTMMLSMIFLVSCVNPTIKPKMLCDISFKKDRCRCRMYDLEKLKSITEPQNYDLEYCEGITGFFIEDVAEEILPKVKAKKRTCKR